ncbi:polymorphic toxin type 50 domain-containing protein [Caballeronia sp. NK8]|uniref:polymorphic toxin type 50 domain-containing protein n=1 Tax=Caballeronia sp. NK8 TaxID=140098 RepID=UPI001BCE4B9A|nr:polymorphic toxin type 50 domain-containing protein [Caballeronia sp. NK8]
MHTAGGALVADLGGGSAAGGAAGAGVSAALAGDLNRLADTFGNGGGTDPGLAAGNIGANVIAGAVGGLIGGNSGAFAGANADLYNRSTTNADGKGSTENLLAGRVWDAVVNTVTDPLGSLNYALNSVIPAPQNQKPDADPNPLIDAHNGNTSPPTGGAVVTPPTVVCAPGGACVVVPGAATAGSAGSVPPNAIFSKDSDDGADNGPTIEAGKQGKHQPGHNNFTSGKSELTYPDPQQLSNDFAGTGQPVNNVSPGQAGYRERVDFGTVIGNYVDPVTGQKTPTTNGIIHYSKDGVHIVPGRP